MPQVKINNNAASRLASSLTNASTSLSVTSGEGAKFPAPTSGDWFPVTVLKSSGQFEIMRCTARTADVLTVTRGQEGTTALPFDAGDRIELRVTAAAFSEFQQKTADAQAAADNAQSSANNAQSSANNAQTTANAAQAAHDNFAVKKDSSAATGAAILPSGTTAQRPASPQNGWERYNTDLKEWERYQDGKWLPFNVMDKALNEAPIVPLASASTVDIGAAAANTINISGSVAITSLGTVAAGAKRTLVFQSTPVLTHNATSLILPGGANITAAAGDVAEFVSLGGGNWRCTNYFRVDSKPARFTVRTGVLASGSAVDFVSIPAWVERITVSFGVVSTTGSANVIVQVGTSTPVATGYVVSQFSSAAPNRTDTRVLGSGFGVYLPAGAADIFSGNMTLTRVAGYLWSVSGAVAAPTGRYTSSAGNIWLGGSLGVLRVTTAGADTFDAGYINITYEG